MSEVILYNRDCIQAMTEIADSSINLILTDPPYNLGNFMISRDTNLKKMRDNFFGAAGITLNTMSGKKLWMVSLSKLREL